MTEQLDLLVDYFKTQSVITIAIEMSAYNKLLDPEKKCGADSLKLRGDD